MDSWTDLIDRPSARLQMALPTGRMRCEPHRATRLNFFDLVLECVDWTPLVALSAGATRFSRRFRSQWGAHSRESLRMLECVDGPH